jgi:hypothetical protein
MKGMFAKSGLPESLVMITAYAIPLYTVIETPEEGRNA